MKMFLDVRDYFVDAAVFEHFEDEAEHAADAMNVLLDLTFNIFPEEITRLQLEHVFTQLVESWCEDPHLIELDVEDFQEWVNQTIPEWISSSLEIDYEEL